MQSENGFEGSDLRPATVAQVPQLVEHFVAATDGVCLCSWSRMFPDRDPRESGKQRLASEDSAFSYRNCEVLLRDGEVIAMTMSFPIPAAADTASEHAEPEDPDDPLAPYALELPGSYYLCAVSVAPAFRGRGLGTALIAQVESKARQLGHDRLSLLVFEENAEALRLYERLGFQEIDRRPMVPHPLITVTGGDIILMAKPL